MQGNKNFTNGGDIPIEQNTSTEKPITKTQIKTQNNVGNVLDHLSFDITFSISDSLIGFTDKIESLSNNLNMIDFTNISDEILNKLKPIIQSLFTYLTVRKDEILNLDRNILNGLKTYYRGIQKKIDSTKIDNSSEKSFSKILNCMVDFLEKGYYLFVPPEKNKELPKEIKTDNVLLFFSDNNRFDDEEKFNQILEQTELVCDEIFKKTDIILNLDLDQLEELKSDIETLITEIQLSINDIKYITGSQEGKLKSIHKKLKDNTLVEIDSQMSIKNFTIKTQIFYTQIPNVDFYTQKQNVDSEIPVIDGKTFGDFINKFRELKRDIIDTKDILLKLEKYDLIILKNLLIEIKSKLNYILEICKQDKTSIISYNASYSLNFISTTLAQIQI
ncbi:MAG: hypothetical protein WC850_04645 [Candidatus Gracilibacteria bacterium]